MESLVKMNTHVQYESPISSGKKVMVMVMRSKRMVPCEGLVTRNTYVQYESSISFGKKVMATVKVFVHTFNMDVDADADTSPMILAPQTFVPAR